jgi:hypothetical protein
MTKEQLAASPRQTAHELLTAIPGGPGYERRVELAVESALNVEWWRGYHAALVKTNP